MKDLAVIVADTNMTFALRGLLEQQRQSLGIHEIESKIEPHPEHDGGVRTTGTAALARFQREFQHGMIMLVRNGSGNTRATGSGAGCPTPSDLGRPGQVDRHRSRGRRLGLGQRQPLEGYSGLDQ